MTATPLHEENRDTYRYFGTPVYTYSLRQGIDDGFLAPYRVHRIVTDIDATGWRPTKDERDRYGHQIPDEEYQTPDYERIIVLKARTQTIAESVVDFLRNTDPFDKTIIFCVDQEHALEMQQAINNLSIDLTQKYPDYVVRITANEGEIGRGHLSRFQELETRTPVVVTTSRLLTTGVDMQTCKNIVIARIVNSMTEFKQIIGRGTRVRADYNKLWFSILDYTGSATRLFADPAFDGDPIDTPTEIPLGSKIPLPEKDQPGKDTPTGDVDEDGEPVKYYVDGGKVGIAVHVIYELDANGKKLRIVNYTDYASETIRSMFTTAAVLKAKWSNAAERTEILNALKEHGITIEQLIENTGQSEADPFDLICYVAFNAPVRTRRERAERIRKGRVDFWEYFKPEAQQILNELLDKYVEYGTAEFKVPDILKVSPISDHGNIIEIAAKFGGPDELRTAIAKMQTLLYAN